MKNRHDKVEVRVLGAEKVLWHAAAGRVGLPLSQWIRMLVNKAARSVMSEKNPEVPPPEEPLSLGGTPIEFDDVPREPQA